MIQLVIFSPAMLVRLGLRALLAMDETCAVMGESATTHQLMRLLRHQLPDILLLVLDGAENGQIEWVQALMSQYPQVKLIVILESLQTNTDMQLYQLGVHACLSVQKVESHLLRAVKAVYTSGLYTSTNLVAQFRVHQQIRQLTQHELRVLQLVCQGLTNREIAQDLHVSVRTAQQYIHTLLGKLQLQNRTEIALFASKQMLV